MSNLLDLSMPNWPLNSEHAIEHSLEQGAPFCLMTCLIPKQIPS